MKKLLPPPQWRIPLAGLLLTAGVVAHQAKPVLSNQIERLGASTGWVVVYRVTPETITEPDSTVSKANSRAERLQKAMDTDKPAQVSSQISPPKLDLATATTTALLMETQRPTIETGVSPTANFPAKDGVYLYGQIPKPDENGQGYIVFEKRQGKVTGALYMPNSEFSCFQGTLDSRGELAMTVTSPASEGSQNDVASGGTLPRVNEDEPQSYAYSVALQDYHQLNFLSANDRRMLQMCKSNQ